MDATKRRYPKEEIAKRGEAIFENEVRANLKGRDPMDFVVIDIESRAYEVDADNLTACLRLRERNPDAQIWGRRVGSRSIRHFGGRIMPERNGDRIPEGSSSGRESDKALSVPSAS